MCGKPFSVFSLRFLLCRSVERKGNNVEVLLSSLPYICLFPCPLFLPAFCLSRRCHSFPTLMSLLCSHFHRFLPLLIWFLLLLFLLLILSYKLHHAITLRFRYISSLGFVAVSRLLFILIAVCLSILFCCLICTIIVCGRVCLRASVRVRERAWRVDKPSCLLCIT